MRGGCGGCDRVRCGRGGGGCCWCCWCPAADDDAAKSLDDHALDDPSKAAERSRPRTDCGAIGGGKEPARRGGGKESARRGGFIGGKSTFTRRRDDAAWPGGDDDVTSVANAMGTSSSSPLPLYVPSGSSSSSVSSNEGLPEDSFTAISQNGRDGRGARSEGGDMRLRAYNIFGGSRHA